MAMKFNPVFHSAVIRNYREAFQRKFNRDCPLADERIWDISNEWTGLEGGVEAEDEAILEQMDEESR